MAALLLAVLYRTNERRSIARVPGITNVLDMLEARYKMAGGERGCEGAFEVLARAVFPFQESLADRGRMAGIATDPPAILAGVRLLCAAQPCPLFFRAFCAAESLLDAQCLAAAAHLFTREE